MISAFKRAEARALRGLAQAAYAPIQDNLGSEIDGALSEMQEHGTLKRERVLTSAQGAWISALLFTNGIVSQN
jgi:hypothetical protein